MGINGALLVIIAFQTAIYWQQRTMMRRQIENAKISERAYIGIKQIVNEDYALGGRPVVRVTLSNGGRTPAYRVKTPGVMTIVREMVDFPDSEVEVGDREGSLFLPAGAEVTVNFPFIVPMTQDWFTAIEAGEHKVFLYIETHFVDVWGDKHVTPFKLAYRTKDNRWGGYRHPEETKPIITIS